MTNVSAPVLASTVRDFYRADASRMARLSPEAQATVKVGSKGRLHKEAVSKFNKGRREHRRYVLGATSNHTEVTAAQRAVLRSKGLAGERGPLSGAAKEFLAQHKG